MVKAALEISENFDTPVLMRVTTRVCHSKSLVTINEPQVATKKPYVKNLQKFDLVPAVSRKLRVNLAARLQKLAAFSEGNAAEFY